MLNIQENIPVGSKTTMRIGGKARYYAELLAKEDAEEAVRFVTEKGIPLIPLGGGSNTIFADGEIEALVVRIKHDQVSINGNNLNVGAGKILASLINELAAKNLDLSALTGIPGTIGGAIFGNAGQGPKGIWLNHFIESVTVFIDGEWKTFSKEECNFRYRESFFKDQCQMLNVKCKIVIWEAKLTILTGPEAEVKMEIESLLKKRIETQPHLKTAGSCFKALADGTPAWKLIDKAGLRGLKVGDIQVAEKHANFLLNTGKATFKDAVAVVEKIKSAVPEIAGVEMRLYGSDGRLVL
jgi:UDP-N-acetylmuramate dehydrogenase